MCTKAYLKLKIVIKNNYRHIYFTKIIVLFILIIFLNMSCTNDKEIEVIKNEEPPIEEITYLALGDSYTIGQGVSENLRWPNQLSDSLKTLQYNINTTDIIAKTGWTTRNLLDTIENTELGEYNLVSLLIGVNNQYQNQSFSVFESEFDILLDKSIEIAQSSSKVLVVSIPDYGVTPFGSSNSDKISDEIDMYNAYIATKCEEQNIPFIDITGISRTLGNSNGALATDKLHPSGSQYTQWLNEIIPVVRLLLEK